jgi:hypothetical protein
VTEIPAGGTKRKSTRNKNGAEKMNDEAQSMSLIDGNHISPFYYYPQALSSSNINNASSSSGYSGQTFMPFQSYMMNNSSNSILPGITISDSKQTNGRDKRNMSENKGYVNSAPSSAIDNSRNNSSLHLNPIIPFTFGQTFGHGNEDTNNSSVDADNQGLKHSSSSQMSVSHSSGGNASGMFSGGGIFYPFGSHWQAVSGLQHSGSQGEIRHTSSTIDLIAAAEAAAAADLDDNMLTDSYSKDGLKTDMAILDRNDSKDYPMTSTVNSTPLHHGKDLAVESIKFKDTELEEEVQKSRKDKNGSDHLKSPILEEKDVIKHYNVRSRVSKREKLKN